jgi:hypothetical protein
MFPIVHGDSPEEPEDAEQEYLKAMYVQAVQSKCGLLKSDAIRYIEERSGMLHAMRDNINRLIDQELAMCNEALHRLTEEIETLLRTVRETPKYEDLVARFGKELH